MKDRIDATCPVGLMVVAERSSIDRAKLGGARLEKDPGCRSRQSQHPVQKDGAI